MYKICEGVTVKQVGTQYMVYNEEKSDMHVVNEVAGKIINYMIDGKSVENIEMMLHQQYSNVDLKTLKDDLQDIIEQYVDLGIILCVEF